MSLVTLLPQILLALGVGFLVANVLHGARAAAAGGGVVRRRCWCGRRASRRITAMSLGIGVVLGMLRALQGLVSAAPAVAVLRRADDVRLLRLYAAAVHAHHARAVRGWHLDRHDLRAVYRRSAGITWRETGEPTLLVIPHAKAVARRLEVPVHVPGRSAARAARQDQQPRHRDGGGTGPAPRRPRRARQRVTFVRTCTVLPVRISRDVMVLPVATDTSGDDLCRRDPRGRAI